MSNPEHHKEKNCCTCETVGNAGGMPKGWKKCPIHGKNKEGKDLHPSELCINK